MWICATEERGFRCAGAIFRGPSTIDDAPFVATPEVMLIHLENVEIRRAQQPALAVDMPRLCCLMPVVVYPSLVYNPRSIEYSNLTLTNLMGTWRSLARRRW